MRQTTLVLVKPGGVARNLVGEVLRRVESRGLELSGLKLMLPSRALVEEHYKEHVGKGFFSSVCDQLTSSPLVAVAVSGENAVPAVRAMMGATNPLDAIPGTVRGDLALSIEDNLVHSSSDPEAAEREVALWFPEGILR